jgi:hypothetical protein
MLIALITILLNLVIGLLDCLVVITPHFRQLNVKVVDLISEVFKDDYTGEMFKVVA